MWFALYAFILLVSYYQKYLVNDIFIIVLLLISHISINRPGQEAGNVPYVEESGFGTYSGEPKNIADTVSSWLSSPEKLKSMQDAALEASRPTATIDIAKKLATMLFDEKAKQKSMERVDEPVLVAK